MIVVNDKNDLRLYFKRIIQNNISLEGVCFRKDMFDDGSIEYVKNNLDILADLGMDLYFLKNLLANDYRCISELDYYFANHQKRIADVLNNSSGLAVQKDVLLFYKNILAKMISNIMMYENAKLSDLRWNLNGYFSDVLFIKDKVIKLGEARYTKTFPNNPYIIKPLLRKTYNISDKNLFVEITEKVFDNCCTMDDAYDIYKKLRDLDILWCDIKISNIGKLKKDNKIYWWYDIKLPDESFELTFYRGNEELKAGEVVLLDADALHDLRKPLNISLYNKTDIDFSRRYTLEKKNK